MIGLDTSAIIDMFKDNQQLKKLIDNTIDTIVSTQLNYLELIFGIDPKNKKHVNEEKYIEKLFNDLIIFNLTKDSIKIATKIHYNQKSKGRTIDQFDSLIAGILISEGVNKIITRNVKQFKEIPGLEVISY